MAATSALQFECDFIPLRRLAIGASEGAFNLLRPDMSTFVTDEFVYFRGVPLERSAKRAPLRHGVDTCGPDMIALVAMMLHGIQIIEQSFSAVRAFFVIIRNNPVVSTMLACPVATYGNTIT